MYPDIIDALVVPVRRWGRSYIIPCKTSLLCHAQVSAGCWSDTRGLLVRYLPAALESVHTSSYKRERTPLAYSAGESSALHLNPTLTAELPVFCEAAKVAYALHPWCIHRLQKSYDWYGKRGWQWHEVIYEGVHPCAGHTQPPSSFQIFRTHQAGDRRRPLRSFCGTSQGFLEEYRAARFASATGCG